MMLVGWKCNLMISQGLQSLFIWTKIGNQDREYHTSCSVWWYRWKHRFLKMSTMMHSCAVVDIGSIIRYFGASHANLQKLYFNPRNDQIIALMTSSSKTQDVATFHLLPEHTIHSFITIQLYYDLSQASFKPPHQGLASFKHFCKVIVLKVVSRNVQKNIWLTLVENMQKLQTRIVVFQECSQFSRFYTANKVIPLFRLAVLYNR